MNITYRTGRKEDCAKLAEFVYIASDGVVEFLFHDLMEGVSPIQMVTHNLAKDTGYYTHKNTIVAEEGSSIVGVSFYYPASKHVISQEMRDLFPADRLEHLKYVLSGVVENSLYLDTLCVDDVYRGKGIGAELIALTKKQAEEQGFNAVSLFALADNTDAHRLYHRCGFEIVSHLEMAPHELIPHEGGAFLMACWLE